VVETKLEWKSIKVPKPLYDKIVMLSKKTNRHIYQIVEEGVNKVEFYLKKPYRKKELPRLDKCSWYIFKLGNSVGAFKENPTPENWNKLMNTITQIKERLGVDTNLLEHIVKKLHPSRSREITVSDKIELNDAVKIVISDVIVKLLFEEGT